MAFKKWIPAAAFGLLMLLYLLVPMQMILKHEQVLQSGTVYKFQPVPRDPFNPFMGRYLTLNFRDDRIPHQLDAETLAEGDAVYLPIAEDSLGYAHFTEALLAPPAEGDYYATTIDWVNAGELSVQMPFNRYYLNEKMAPQAEQVYDKLLREDSIDVYAQVRILDGQAVLEELYFNDLPVERFLSEKE
ncbi:MAG: GDYXXLXY domain-containing protein [Bacteroidota bacterium]